MNILLTANYKNGIFCNGLQQNINFLAELLKDIGANPMIAVSHPIEECVDPPHDILIMEENEILDHCESLDYLLQTSWDPAKQIIDSLRQGNKNFKNVHIHYGNRLLADIEQSSWKKTRPITPHNVDEIWVSPHYNFSIPYFKTYYKTQKVFNLPYIWSPKYIKTHEEMLSRNGDTCFYSKDKEKNIGIFEPNLNITKHCLPSIMIAEELYRQDKSLFNKLNVYCSSKLKEANYFKMLMWQLDLQADSKINFKPRKIASLSFAKETSISLSNQLLNSLNYTYMEALYLGVPLVHNSEDIKSSGYFYPKYDIQKGADALRLALTYHDQNIEEYKINAEKTIYRYSPDNPSVKEEYRKLLS